MKTIFINGRAITPERVLENCAVTVLDGRIQSVESLEDTDPQGRRWAESHRDAEIVDLDGRYLMPGFIDIHSDMIENVLQPRSTAMMDFSFGLREAEKQLAACGITTIFHSISMFRSGSWDAREIRTAPRVKELAELVKTMREGKHLIHNRYHLRYELDNPECYQLVKELLGTEKVQLLSLMDHRPGQGQYRDLAVYRRHLPSGGKNLTDEEFAELVSRELKKPMVEQEKIEELVQYARERGIPVASHDDDTLEKVERNRDLGVGISEFPISLEVARRARETGVSVLLGAPNILLGGSHSGNLSAEEAVREGCADILCSDYYPQALLSAVFYLADRGAVSLPQACAFVSKNPAEAAGIAKETGTLEPGKQADLLVVERNGEGEPILCSAWVSGRRAMSMNYAQRKGE